MRKVSAKLTDRGNLGFLRRCMIHLKASSDEEAGRFSGLIEGNYFINYMKRVITTSLEYNKELIVLAKNLRKNMTKAERKLWYEFLKNYQVKFQRQKTIENYIVDFYCAKAKIVIELDGGGHYTPEQIECDQERTKVLLKLLGKKPELIDEIAHLA